MWGLFINAISVLTTWKKCVNKIHDDKRDKFGRKLLVLLRKSEEV